MALAGVPTSVYESMAASGVYLPNNPLFKPTYTADYKTGEIFTDPTPASVRSAMAAWSRDKNDLMLEDKAFQALYKESPELAYSMLHEDGYDNFNKGLKKVFAPQSVGFVPGLLGSGNEDSSNANTGMYKRWMDSPIPQLREQAQRMAEQQNRRLIDNWMKTGDTSKLIQPQQNQQNQQKNAGPAGLLAGLERRE